MADHDWFYAPLYPTTGSGIFRIGHPTSQMALIVSWTILDMIQTSFSVFGRPLSMPKTLKLGKNGRSRLVLCSFVPNHRLQDPRNWSPYMTDGLSCVVNYPRSHKISLRVIRGHFTAKINDFIESRKSRHTLI